MNTWLHSDCSGREHISTCRDAFRKIAGYLNLALDVGTLSFLCPSLPLTSCPRDQVQVTLFTAVMRRQKKKRLRERGFILAHNLRRDTVYHGEGREGYGNRSVRPLVAFHTQAGSRGCWMLVLSLPSHFIKSSSLAHGLVLPTVRASLPSLVNSL